LHRFIRIDAQQHRSAETDRWLIGGISMPSLAWGLRNTHRFDGFEALEELGAERWKRVLPHARVEDDVQGGTRFPSQFVRGAPRALCMTVSRLAADRKHPENVVALTLKERSDRLRRQATAAAPSTRVSGETPEEVV
jgi:hypothetical protein